MDTPENVADHKSCDNAHWLMQLSQLTNYYQQVALNGTLNAITEEQWADDRNQFPNAIYLDAVDCGGTVRTGQLPLADPTRPRPPGHGPNGYGQNHETARFSYAHLLIHYNIRKACATNARGHAHCAEFVAKTKKFSDEFPVNTWKNTAFGRWPNSQWPCKGWVAATQTCPPDSNQGPVWPL